MCQEPVVSKIEYWFLFCPRYRRKIFSDEKACSIFKNSAKASLASLGLSLHELIFHDDHILMRVSGSALIAPADIVFKVKKDTAAEMRKQVAFLEDVKSIWTKNSYISTIKPSGKEIEEYRSAQKRRN